MDVRDLAFWFREAQKKLVSDQIKAINAARLAMDAEGREYQRVNEELQTQLKKIDKGEDRAVLENWEELRAREKG